MGCGCSQVAFSPTGPACPACLSRDHHPKVSGPWPQDSSYPWLSIQTSATPPSPADKPAHQPPQLWLLLRFSKPLAQPTVWQELSGGNAVPLLWPHRVIPQPGFSVCSHWTDVQVRGPHCLGRCTAGTEASTTATRPAKPPEGLPHPPGGHLPLAPLQPLVPHHRDQFTGQEMNVAQFLMHIGPTCRRWAQQQGLEPSKLLDAERELGPLRRPSPSRPSPLS